MNGCSGSFVSPIGSFVSPISFISFNFFTEALSKSSSSFRISSSSSVIPAISTFVWFFTAHTVFDAFSFFPSMSIFCARTSYSFIFFLVSSVGFRLFSLSHSLIVSKFACFHFCSLCLYLSHVFLYRQAVSTCRNTLTVSLASVCHLLFLVFLSRWSHIFTNPSATRSHTDHMLGGQCKESFSLQLDMANAVTNPTPMTLNDVHFPTKAFLNLPITFNFFNSPMNISARLFNQVPVESLLVNRFFSWGLST